MRFRVPPSKKWNLHSLNNVLSSWINSAGKLISLRMKAWKLMPKKSLFILCQHLHKERFHTQKAFHIHPHSSVILSALVERNKVRDILFKRRKKCTEEFICAHLTWDCDVQHVLIENFSSLFPFYFKLQVHSPQKAHLQRCSLFNVGKFVHIFASQPSTAASRKKKLINFQFKAVLCVTIKLQCVAWISSSSSMKVGWNVEMNRVAGR